MNLQSHAVILGYTQSGKTTTALTLLSSHKNYIKIFVNTKRENKVRKYFHFLILDADAMKEVYEDYPRSTKYMYLIEPDVTDRSATDQIAKIFDVTLQYHQKDPTRYKTVIMIDEIQVYQSKFSKNESFARLWTMGLGLGIRAVAIAQRPQMINNDLLFNSETWIIHKQIDADMEYLKDKGVINYDKEKHIFTWTHDAFIQTNKSTGLKRLDTKKIKGI